MKRVAVQFFVFTVVGCLLHVIVTIVYKWLHHAYWAWSHSQRSRVNRWNKKFNSNMLLLFIHGKALEEVTQHWDLVHWQIIFVVLIVWKDWVFCVVNAENLYSNAAVQVELETFDRKETNASEALCLHQLSPFCYHKGWMNNDTCLSSLR